MTVTLTWWDIVIITLALVSIGFMVGWEAHRSRTWRRRLDRLKHPDDREYE